MSKPFFRAHRPLVTILVVSLLVSAIATIVQSVAACNTPDKSDKYNPYNPPGHHWPWQYSELGKWIVLLNNSWGRFGGFGDGWDEFRPPFW